jgi:hypothetical protein
MRDDRGVEAQSGAEGVHQTRSLLPERLLILLIVLLVAYAFAA